MDKAKEERRKRREERRKKLRAEAICASESKRMFVGWRIVGGGGK